MKAPLFAHQHFNYATAGLTAFQPRVPVSPSVTPFFWLLAPGVLMPQLRKPDFAQPLLPASSTPPLREWPLMMARGNSVTFTPNPAVKRD